MKIRSITNIRRLIVSFALIAMLHVTGCGGLEFDTSAQTVEATETSTDTGYEPVFVHYDGSWHILYKKVVLTMCTQTIIHMWGIYVSGVITLVQCAWTSRMALML